MWDNIAPAVAVTQLEPPVVAPGPVLDMCLAISAFQSALDAGFLSASGSDPEAASPHAPQPGQVLGEGGIPPGSGATASSFVMLQPSNSAGPALSAPPAARPLVTAQGPNDEVYIMLRNIAMGQSTMFQRLEVLEGGAVVSGTPVRAPIVGAHVSFAEATPGIGAMQSAGELLSSAPAWASPLPLSVASTVPCQAAEAMQVPQMQMYQSSLVHGDMDSGASSDDVDGDAGGEFNGPPLIAEAHARRARRQQERSSPYLAPSGQMAPGMQGMPFQP